MKAVEEDDATGKATVKARRTALRDATEALKAVAGTGAASAAKLSEIRAKAELPDG